MKKMLHADYQKGLLLSAAGFSPEYLAQGDFWRLMLDTCRWGGNREIAVYSHEQKEPQIIREEKRLVLKYDGILAADGSSHDIILTLTITEQDGAVYYAAEMENNSAVRINELQYPLFQVKRFAGALEEDTLVLPRGLGRKRLAQAHPQKDSIRQLQGWQRIIMKHQYGEIFHTYDELPRLYEEGAKYGVHMILLFGWWEEGMDAGYPNYRPDPAMGGEEKLKEAIKKVHEMGGRVILYANGHLIDLATDYYKQEGCRYTMKGIDGSEYQDFYKFSDHGTLLRFGHKAFAMGCFGTEEWAEKILEIEDRHLALGSSGAFFDQLGCAFCLCFDKTHSHGNRIDLDPELRYHTILKMREKLTGDQWFGTEWPCDRISPIMDFTHGCGFAMTYTKNAYPHIFRYAFPEVQVTNRFLHDEQKDWEKHLNYAFVHGLMYDVSLYRCRAKSIEDEPNMAAHMKKLIDLRKEYLPFFTDGRYDLPEIPYPEGVWGAGYTLNGETIQTVWNDTGKIYIAPEGTKVYPGEVIIVKL